MTDIADCSDQFEPAAVENFSVTEGVLLASIAISLKRIADAATAPGGLNFENAAWEAGRAFMSGQRSMG